MRFLCLVAGLLGWSLGSPVWAEVTALDDIRFWVGEGSQRAAMVIDWTNPADAPPLAWGFRWDGTATGEDMFRALVQADRRLFAKLGEEGPFGVPLFGIGYDRDADGFKLSDGTVFDGDGIAITEPSDGAYALDPDDSYDEGWNEGFWGYYISEESPYTTGQWDIAPTGFSQRILADGAWDGYSFAPGFVGDPPAVPEAARRFHFGMVVTGKTTSGSQLGVKVPEPSAILLPATAIFGVGFLTRIIQPRCHLTMR
jgi:hypothetical protein